MTQKEGSSCSLNIEIDIPRAARHYVQDICNTCSLLTASQWFTVLHRPAVCVHKKKELYLASGPLCIVWKETICVLSGLISFAASDPLFLPPALRGKRRVNIWYLWDVKLESPAGTLVAVKGNWPQNLMCLVSFEMPYGTKILFFPLIYEGMKIISALSGFKGFQSCVVKDMKHAKISVCKVVQVNSVIPLSLSCAQLFKP